jgi:hypothetical protein
MIQMFPSAPQSVHARLQIHATEGIRCGSLVLRPVAEVQVAPEGKAQEGEVARGASASVCAARHVWHVLVAGEKGRKSASGSAARHMRTHSSVGK